MTLSKFSFGIGDRFSHQGQAQLRAIIKANEAGVEVSPVWNKSNREHSIVGTLPVNVREEADAAVVALGWEKPYFVDADHINLNNVSSFVDASDFFTLDVATYISCASSPEAIEAFKVSCQCLGDRIAVPGIEKQIEITDEILEEVAAKYLAAIKEAGRIFRHISLVKGNKPFVTEVSMDEVEKPQTPIDLLFILKMIADEEIPVQTIAPKFSGRFNKGVDYVGDLNHFALEFEEDVLVIDFAVKTFGLPADLKLSVHSGSDKFSIYPIMADIIGKYDVGLHVKTAGTSWLEEVIGLALSGDEALAVAKEIYTQALQRKEELCGPYADVINIDEAKLPTVEEVSGWTGEKFASTLRHIPGHADYNPNFRQLIHVGYKVAAEMGEQYYSLLEKNAAVIGCCVEENIYDRHLKRLFNL